MIAARRSLVAALLAATAAGCSDSPTWPESGLEADAGSWKTWVIESGSALRPPPPPAEGSAETRAALDEIAQLQATLSEQDRASIERWDASPTAPWTNLAIDLLEFYVALLPDERVGTPPRSGRVMALLHVAIYDALVATWDTKYAYNREPPFRVDDRIEALGEPVDIPSYPSEHAAAAAAAVEVLKYLFPKEDSARFEALATEAGESRIAAGLAYRGDVEAGWALGRAVAQRVLEHAMQDGSGGTWTGSVPSGDGMWEPTPPRFIADPYDPLAGSWHTWVLPSGEAFRPEPPPAIDSELFQRDLEELRQISAEVTEEQADIARYWATEAPSAWWELFLLDELTSRGVSTMRAARAHALLSVAIYDAYVACWDGKFHYWLVRPITMDSTIVPVFSTPPFPSYPSGHSTISTAAGEIFAYLFADAAHHYREKAHEASVSRVWGGVHYRFDIVAGEELGVKVGEAVIAHARSDGSQG